MILWRLTAPEHAPGLDGEGARLWGGRWNSPGVAVVYASGALSLAVLETWVHLPPPMRRPDAWPPRVAVRIALPEGEAPEAVEGMDLADRAGLRAFGDAWARERRSLALAVPSAVVPPERNVILNPAHPGMAGVRVLGVEPFAFDPRLAG